MDIKPKREKLDADMVVEVSEPPTPPRRPQTEPGDNTTKVTVERDADDTTITVKGKRFKLEIQRNKDDIKIVM